MFRSIGVNPLRRDRLGDVDTLAPTAELNFASPGSWLSGTDLVLLCARYTDPPRNAHRPKANNSDMRFSNFQRCVDVNPAKDVPGPAEANYPKFAAQHSVGCRCPTARCIPAGVGKSIETKLQMRCPGA